MGKEILTIKINFTAIKSYFLKDVDIDKVLESNKISSDEKIYMYFIGYLYNDKEVKLSYIMLPKTNA